MSEERNVGQGKFCKGEVYIPGFKEGDVFHPGFKAGGVHYEQPKGGNTNTSDTNQEKS